MLGLWYQTVNFGAEKSGCAPLKGSPPMPMTVDCPSPAWVVCSKQGSQSGEKRGKGWAGGGGQEVWEPIVVGSLIISLRASNQEEKKGPVTRRKRGAPTEKESLTTRREKARLATW